MYFCTLLDLYSLNKITKTQFVRLCRSATIFYLLTGGYIAVYLKAILKSQSETGSNCRHYNHGVFKHNKISDEPALSQYLGKSQKEPIKSSKFQSREML